jgi:hypothetical protein
MKFKKLWSAATLAAVFAVAAVSSTAQAAENPLQGAWKLVGYKVVSQDTGKSIPAMGEHPTGRVIFTENHRVSFVLTGDGRTAGKSEAEKAALLDSLVAYTGLESLKGDEWCTKVEAAWNPAWVGTTQCREFHVDGNRLDVLTPWRQMPNWPGTTRSIITFERDQS